MQAVQAAGFSRLYAVYKNYPAHPMCSHRARLVLDVPEQCCGVCLSTLTDRGSASCSRVLTVAGTVLDRGRNTRARPTSNLPASIRCTGIPGRHSRRTRNPVSHSRRADSLDGAPLGAPQNQGGAERLENVGNPPEAVSRVAVSPPGCGAAGERQDTGGNCGNWRNGPAGCCPQPWIPVGGDQRSGLQCFFVQWFQRLGVAQAIILRAGARCHRTVTSS
jgi:hypothetical protein